MLIDVQLRDHEEPWLKAFSEGVNPERLREGVYLVSHSNFEEAFVSDGWYDAPTLSEEPMGVWAPGKGGYEKEGCPLGICDSVEQFLAHKLGLFVAAHPTRKFVVAFTHVPKGVGIPCGFRWASAEPYIGVRKRECKYLADEQGFEDGVYLFHVHEQETNRTERNDDGSC